MRQPFASLTTTSSSPIATLQAANAQPCRHVWYLLVGLEVFTLLKRRRIALHATTLFWCPISHTNSYKPPVPPNMPATKTTPDEHCHPIVVVVREYYLSRVAHISGRGVWPVLRARCIEKKVARIFWKPRFFPSQEVSVVLHSPPFFLFFFVFPTFLIRPPFRGRGGLSSPSFNFLLRRTLPKRYSLLL